MGKSQFQNLYRENWVATAHGFGLLGNLVFCGICYWEYGILMVLGWGKLMSVSFPFTIELILWFFAGVGMKQIICEQQKRQQGELDKAIAAWKSVRRKGEYTDQEEESARLQIIEDKQLVLLYGTKIPDSGIHVGVTIFVVVVFLIASIFIITSNRNASNKRIEDAEIFVACHQIDSTAKLDVQTFAKDVNAQVGSISARGSADTRKIEDLKTQIKNIQNDIASTAYLAVNRKSELYGEKKKAEKKLTELMDGDNYAVQKADKEQEITAYEKKVENQVKADKQAATLALKEKHSKKNAGINVLAIITNILYLLFKYWIVKVRAITGEWTFDLFEWLFDLVVLRIERIAASETVKEGPSVSSLENEPKQPLESEKKPNIKVVTQNEPEVETPKADDLVDLEHLEAVLSKKRESGGVLRLVRNKNPKPMAKQVESTTSRREKMTANDFESFMQAEGFEFEGCTAKNIFDSVLKNGRDAEKAERFNSPPVARMNRLLDRLREYGILIDPDNHTQRGGFIRVVAQKEAA